MNRVRFGLAALVSAMAAAGGSVASTVPNTQGNPIVSSGRAPSGKPGRVSQKKRRKMQRRAGHK